MMKKILKKITFTILSLLILVSSNLSFAPNVYAEEGDSTWYNQPFAEWYAKVYGSDSPPTEIFGERYTAAQVQWIVWALISQPLNWAGRDNQEFIACAFTWAGNEPVDMEKCWLPFASFFLKIIRTLSPFPVGQNINQESALSLMSQNSVGLQYITEQINKFHIVQNVNAQDQKGFGYGAMGIVQPLWDVSRNFSYALLVVFIIVFAFMIMFKVKISPQVVISVQSALPKVIIAAILATFSFAIAGLVIDFMYVVAGVVAGFLSPANFTGSFDVLYAFITGSSPIGTLASPFLILAYMLVYTILFLVLVVVSLATTMSTFSLFAGLLSILALLLVAWLLILCVWYMIKIPWVLIKALIGVFLSVIVAPVQIVAGALVPQIGFGAWIKNLIANVMVFPLVGIMFLFSYWFLGFGFLSAGKTAIERNIGLEAARGLGIYNAEGFLPGNLWSPPFLGGGAEITPLIFALMSFGVVIAIPKATEILKAALLGAKFDYGMAISEAMGPVKWGYRVSGAEDYATILQNIRRSKFIEARLDENTLTGQIARWVAGSDAGVEKAATGHKQKAGIE